MSIPVAVAVQLDADDDNGICASQTPLAAGNLTINGALASGGVATLDAQRRVLITTAADETARTFTITGTNKDGAPISEEIAGVNNTTVSSVLDYKTVTQVAVDDATAGAIIVGTSGVGASPWQAVNPWSESGFTLSIGVVVSGTVNFTVQYTLADDPCGIRTAPVGAIKAWDISDLASKTADTAASIVNPVTAWRLQINSGTGTATATAVQVGR